jgi:tetratricopeptide (TPR) repeat protein
VEPASIEDDPQRPNWRAATLADLSEIALAEGDLDRAWRYAEESVAAGGGPRVHLDFAEIALRRGDLQSAAERAMEALTELEVGSFNYACGLELLGESARRAGDEGRARERFSEGLRRFSDLNDAGGVADCLDGLGRLAADRADSDHAALLFGAAEQLRETWSRMPIRSDIPFPEVPEAAPAAGRALSLHEAVERALASID